MKSMTTEKSYAEPKQTPEYETTFSQSIARKLVLNKLALIRNGCLEIREGQNVFHYGDSNAEPVRVEVVSPQLWAGLALGGINGAGDAYIQGLWRTDDLVSVIRLMLQNAATMQKLESRILPLTKSIDKIRHWRNRNSEHGSAKNIHAHYDLGNDFFRLFLDEQMMYSSAYYPSRDSTLEHASVAKLERICCKLNLQSTDHVLEIGTGWGGFAVYAAREFGCKVTTTTISKEQYDYARERVAQLRLSDQITVLQQDYRKLEGQYDKLVSIEMIEAVGHQFLDVYVAQCNRLLKPEGVLFLQAITIRDQVYDSAVKNVDFIKKYIFPGGFLPSIHAISSALTRVSDMKIVQLEDIGDHYARTLADWHQRFMKNVHQVQAQGFPDTFIRLWQFYLNYCEGSFRESYIGVVQLLANKPNANTAVAGRWQIGQSGA